MHCLLLISPNIEFSISAVSTDVDRSMWIKQIWYLRQIQFKRELMDPQIDRFLVLPHETRPIFPLSLLNVRHHMSR